jgi:uncharacterized protein YukE
MYAQAGVIRQKAQQLHVMRRPCASMRRQRAMYATGWHGITGQPYEEASGILLQGTGGVFPAARACAGQAYADPYLGVHSICGLARTASIPGKPSK